MSFFGNRIYLREALLVVNIDFREIETFHDNVIETFAPVDYLDI